MPSTPPGWDLQSGLLKAAMIRPVRLRKNRTMYSSCSLSCPHKFSFMWLIRQKKHSWSQMPQLMSQADCQAQIVPADGFWTGLVLFTSGFCDTACTGKGRSWRVLHPAEPSARGKQTPFWCQIYSSTLQPSCWHLNFPSYMQDEIMSMISIWMLPRGLIVLLSPTLRVV